MQAADAGELPLCVVIDFVLAETMNGLTQEVAYEDTITALSMIRQSSGFSIQRTGKQVWHCGLNQYETHAHLSLVDAILVAYAQEQTTPFLYSFDDALQ